MNEKQQNDSWGKIVARAWADEGFKKRLIAEPATALKEHGVEVPAGCQVKVVEDTETLFHLTLPPKPTSDELSEEELSQAAGGFCCRACFCIKIYRCLCESVGPV